MIVSKLRRFRKNLTFPISFIRSWGLWRHYSKTESPFLEELFILFVSFSQVRALDPACLQGMDIFSHILAEDFAINDLET